MEQIALSQVFRAMGQRASLELFAAYGLDMEVQQRPWSPTDERLYCGSIGFAGRGLRGTCVLAANERPLLESCPEGGRLRDWVGELANQLAGRVKVQILARGTEV